MVDKPIDTANKGQYKFISSTNIHLHIQAEHNLLAFTPQYSSKLQCSILLLFIEAFIFVFASFSYQNVQVSHYRIWQYK